jgi:hypothetical protein
MLEAVDLSFRVEMLTPQQCEALRTGTLALGLLRPPALGSDITTVSFAKEPLLLLFRRIIPWLINRTSGWQTSKTSHGSPNEPRDL